MQRRSKPELRSSVQAPPVRTGTHSPDALPGKSDIPAAYRLSTYQYDLPPELIAQEPAHRRDESKLLGLNRASGAVRHHTFKELPSLLRPSDLLVLNETRVTPCALAGRKASGGRVRLLVLDPATPGQAREPDHLAERICMAASSKPLRSGVSITLDEGPDLLVMEILAPGRVVVRFPVPEGQLLNFLDRYGRTPLPPYIKPEDPGHARHRERYQTVYSRIAGSVAAPTAGLHFTEELIHELRTAGVAITRIVLHVGPGTFTPVRQEDVRLHKMETELYEISDLAAREIQTALDEGRRVIAVGTTTVRTLESARSADGSITSGAGRTNLFILPGHQFRSVHGLLTNFHLPGSTLLMLVCAFAGIESVFNAYTVAMGGRYRFYSYGDACLIL